MKKGAAFHKSKMEVTKDGLQCTQDGVKHYRVDGLVMLSHDSDTECLDVIKPSQHITDGMLEYDIYEDDSECVEDFTDGFLDGWITTFIYGCGVFVGLMLALAIYKFIF